MYDAAGDMLIRTQRESTPQQLGSAAIMEVILNAE
jgi:hypothetical protein